MPSPYQVGVDVFITPQSLRSSVGQIQSQFNRLNPNLSKIDKFNNAIGRITGNATEFQKSLDAATARVFAFGAAVGVINAVVQSFKSLVSTTIEVEKRLIEINSIFGATTSEFAKFRTEIFNVAKNTGQTFGVVADAAAELARQGLSASETANRLNASLVLTRVGALDSVKAVESLTAAINGFASAGLSANEIVNKIVAVDTAFAVSAGDLAEGFARVGSTAEDAGVSFDQLLGLITAVQQRTSRGGAVIGNAFKSIFTRLSRSDTIDQLQQLGVEIDSSQDGVQKLNALSNALERISDPTVASQIKELAGGVFQINVVSAALKDLSSDTSIFARSATTAANATNEAFQKNAELNKSLSAQINALVIGVTNLSEKIGQIAVAPLFKDIVQITTGLIDSLNNAFSNDKAKALIEGFFGVIGNFISGPGIALVGLGFAKIFQFIAKFAKDALKEIIDFRGENQRIRDIQNGIVQLLQRDETFRNTILSTTASQAQKEKAVLQAIERENAALQFQKTLTEQIARLSLSKGITGFAGNKGFFAKGGKVPNFAKSPLEQAISREKKAGVPVSKIRVNADKRLISAENPLGLAVTNTRDEPRGLRDVFDKGRVPNYAQLRTGAEIFGRIPPKSQLDISFERSNAIISREANLAKQAIGLMTRRAFSLQKAFSDLEFSINRATSPFSSGNLGAFFQPGESNKTKSGKIAARIQLEQQERERRSNIFTQQIERDRILQARSRGLVSIGSRISRQPLTVTPQQPEPTRFQNFKSKIRSKLPQNVSSKLFGEAGNLSTLGRVGFSVAGITLLTELESFISNSSSAARQTKSLSKEIENLREQLQKAEEANDQDAAQGYREELAKINKELNNAENASQKFSTQISRVNSVLTTLAIIGPDLAKLGKLGRAGIVTAIGTAGFSAGTALDLEFGISDKISDFINKANRGEIDKAAQEFGDSIVEFDRTIRSIRENQLKRFTQSLSNELSDSLTVTTEKIRGLRNETERFIDSNIFGGFSSNARRALNINNAVGGLRQNILATRGSESQFLEERLSLASSSRGVGLKQFETGVSIELKQALKPVQDFFNDSLLPFQKEFVLLTANADTKKFTEALSNAGKAGDFSNLINISSKRRQDLLNTSGVQSDILRLVENFRGQLGRDLSPEDARTVQNVRELVSVQQKLLDVFSRIESGDTSAVDDLLSIQKNISSILGEEVGKEFQNVSNNFIEKQTDALEKLEQERIRSEIELLEKQRGIQKDFVDSLNSSFSSRLSQFEAIIKSNRNKQFEGFSVLGTTNIPTLAGRKSAAGSFLEDVSSRGISLTGGEKQGILGGFLRGDLNLSSISGRVQGDLVQSLINRSVGEQERLSIAADFEGFTKKIDQVLSLSGLNETQSSLIKGLKKEATSFFTGGTAGRSTDGFIQFFTRLQDIATKIEGSEILRGNIANQEIASSEISNLLLNTFSNVLSGRGLFQNVEAESGLNRFDSALNGLADKLEQRQQSLVDSLTVNPISIVQETAERMIDLKNAMDGLPQLINQLKQEIAGVNPPPGTRRTDIIGSEVYGPPSPSTAGSSDTE